MMTSNKEKEVLINILKMYKDMPYLWQKDHKDYLNKQKRAEAYEVLLEAYKKFDEDVTMKTLKKKIENLRACYARELKKVIASKQGGQKNGELEYRPTIWFYEHLHFLNRIYLDKISIDSKEFEDNEVTDVTYLESDNFFDENEETKPKKQKYSTVFLPEQSANDIYHNDQDLSLNVSSETETLAFGKTIGLQLKELEGYQKIIAEKLISDVIFYARLGKLTTTTTLKF